MLAYISILYRKKAIKTIWYKSSFQHYDLRLQLLLMLYVYSPTFFVTCLPHIPFILNCIETAKINPPQLHHLIPLPRFHTSIYHAENRTVQELQGDSKCFSLFFKKSGLKVFCIYTFFYHITSSLLPVHICLCFPLPVKNFCMNSVSCLVTTVLCHRNIWGLKNITRVPA